MGNSIVGGEGGEGGEGGWGISNFGGKITLAPGLLLETIFGSSAIISCLIGAIWIVDTICSTGFGLINSRW